MNGIIKLLVGICLLFVAHVGVAQIQPIFIIEGPTQVCPNQEAWYTCNVQGNSYFWQVPGGTVLQYGSSRNQAKIRWSSTPGDRTITISVTSSGTGGGLEPAGPQPITGIPELIEEPTLEGTTTSYFYHDVTVGGAFNTGSISGSTTKCAPASGSVSLSGYDGNIVKWQYSTNGGSSWYDISSTSSTYSYSNQYGNKKYRAYLRYTGTCGTQYKFSPIATVTVKSIPETPLLSYDYNYQCNATHVSAHGVVSNSGEEYYLVTDRNATTGIRGTVLNLAPSGGLTLGSENTITWIVTTEQTYYLRVKGTNGCFGTAIQVGSGAIRVDSRPGMPTLVSKQSRIGGGNLSFTMSGGTSYKVYSSSGSTSGISEANNTITRYVSSSRTYWVSALDGDCEGATADRRAVSLTVYSPPTISGPTGNKICDQATLTASSGFDSYSWKKNGEQISSSRSITANSPGTYEVTVSKSGSANTYTKTITLTSDKPSLPNFGAAQVSPQGCNNSRVIVSGLPSGDQNTYYLTTSSTTKSGILATKNSNGTISATITATNRYFIRVKNSNGCWGDGAKDLGTLSVETPPAKPALVSSQNRIGEGFVDISISGDGDTYYLHNPPFTPQQNATGSFSQRIISGDNTVTAKIYKNGCASENLTFSLTVYGIPTISGPANNLLFGSATLTATGSFDSYSWKRNGTTVGTGQSLPIDQPGSYTLTVTKNDAINAYTTSPLVITEGTLEDQPAINYIETNTVLVEGQTDPAAVSSLPIGQRNQSIQYFDGLGRPIQTVSTKASPNRKDMVQPMAYDAVGRQAFAFLPYESAEESGWYKREALNDARDPIAEQAAYQGSEHYVFYNSTGQKIDRDAFPFAQSRFEASPLNRVVEQGAPGAAWQLSGGKTIETNWRTNSQADAVLLWQYTFASGDAFGSIASDGYYADNQLYITDTEDEEGNRVSEFTDKLGQVVLKEVEGDGGERLRTYYVYDDFGNLRAVLPPLLTANLSNQAAGSGEGAEWVNDPISVNTTSEDTYLLGENGSVTLTNGFTYTASGNNSFTIKQGNYSFTASELAELGFWYHYDGRRRMVEKHVPGGGVVHMVYDQWDRLVLTQDENQRKNKEWLYTKYDALNRPVVTGIWNSESSRSTLQDDINGQTANNIASRYVTRNPNKATGYDLIRSYPKFEEDDKVLSLTYYDDYSWLSSDAYDFATQPGWSETIEMGGRNRNYPFPSAANSAVKGQVTGSKVRILESSDYLQTVTYYDDKYLPIQVVADNQLGGKDISSTLYNFPGWVLATRHSHSNGERSLLTTTRNTYDHTGRLLDTYQTTGVGEEVLLAHNEYNSLGELVDKKLHSEDGGSNFQQSVDYRYNIRGWLTHINNRNLNASILRDELPTNDNDGDLFGFELKYNEDLKSGGTAKYNGNIAEIMWRSMADSELGNDQSLRAYHFNYDKLNRLKAANFRLYSGGNWTSLDVDKFSTSYSYDQNGNILNLMRKGQKQDGSYGTMDQLSYSYAGNQLLAVQDSQDKQAGFIDGANLSEEYLYDGNGNLTEDKNKGIASIAYNQLNLPKEVVKTDGSKLLYTYDAAGIKLRQQVYDAAGHQTKQTDYVGGLIYENGQLQFMQTAEGRVLLTDNGEGGYAPEYQYHLKDHLGNVRLSFSSQKQEEEHLATFELEEQVAENANFQNYIEQDMISQEAMNHTPGGSKVLRLNGAMGDTHGPRKSFQLQGGETFMLEVYARYVDLRNSDFNSAQIIAALMGGGGYTVTTDGGGATTISSTSTTATAVLGGEGSNPAPQAYLQYGIANGATTVDAGMVQVSIAAAVTAEGSLAGPHERLALRIEIPEAYAGYTFFAELAHNANENVDVFFDDFSIERLSDQPSIIQEDSYYPFGLTFNSWQKPNMLKNQFLFNGKERMDELGWDDFSARMYDPALGRWYVVDPLADQMRRHSPYNYAFDNPIRFIDPDGMAPVQGGGPGDPPKGRKKGPSYYSWSYIKNTEMGKGLRAFGNWLLSSKMGDARYEQGGGFPLESAKSGPSDSNADLNTGDENYGEEGVNIDLLTGQRVNAGDGSYGSLASFFNKIGKIYDLLTDDEGEASSAGTDENISNNNSSQDSDEQNDNEGKKEDYPSGSWFKVSNFGDSLEMNPQEEGLPYYRHVRDTSSYFDSDSAKHYYDPIN